MELSQSHQFELAMAAAVVVVERELYDRSAAAADE